MGREGNQQRMDGACVLVRMFVGMSGVRIVIDVARTIDKCLESGARQFSGIRLAVSISKHWLHSFVEWGPFLVDAFFLDLAKL